MTAFSVAIAQRCLQHTRTTPLALCIVHKHCKNNFLSFLFSLAGQNKLGTNSPGGIYFQALKEVSKSAFLISSYEYKCITSSPYFLTFVIKCGHLQHMEC